MMTEGLGKTRATYATTPEGMLKPWIRETLDQLPPERRATIERFLHYLEARQFSPGTVKCYVQTIRTMGFDGKPYEELTAEDLIEWQRALPYCRIAGGNGGKLGDRTVDTYRGFMKSFLRWVHNGTKSGAEPPECLGAIRRTRPKPDLRKEVLTLEEVRRIADACSNQRDRALIMTGYESGARPGEILSLRLRDIEPDRYGVVAIVKGKTGERRVRLIQSVPDLQLWLNIHPLRDNKDAPLWPTRWNKGMPITVTHFHRLLLNYSKLAGVNKRVHPHLLRHSRATHLASVFTEAQLRIYFGWTKRSDMPEVYVHLSGRDVDQALLKLYGIVPDVKEDLSGEVLKPVRCPRCGLENPAGFEYCGRCSMSLRVKPSAEKPEHHEGAEEAVALFIREVLRQDPELAKRILDKSGMASILTKMVLEAPKNNKSISTELE